MILLVPKVSLSAHGDHPLYFLAGPVRGAGNWQQKASRLIFRKRRRAIVVTPVRAGHNDLDALRASGLLPDGLVMDRFPNQTLWERHYLELAGDPKAHAAGCIIFWLPEESTTEPHPGPEPYAMDSRGELGEWRGRMMGRPDLRIVIGAEPGFLGLRTIQRNFECALGKEITIHDSLAKTVQAALDRQYL